MRRVSHIRAVSAAGLSTVLFLAVTALGPAPASARSSAWASDNGLLALR